MRLDDYAAYDALGLAELVRSRQVSALELAQTARSAIEAVNGDLNAVIGLTDREAAAALERASNSDAQFAGVPFLIKDNAPIEGELHELGSRLCAGHVAEADSELTSRFKACGFVTLGRTNLPEFGDPPTTEPLLHGPTHNPWALGRSPGGSSGGSAAAVAAGVVPVAHANDGGGSTRIPAGWCGLVGLKPSRGRTPIGPRSSTFSEINIGEHVVTRTVRDCAAVLDGICGPEDADFIALPKPCNPFLSECDTDPGRLRIALRPTLSSGVMPTPDRAAAFDALAGQLRALGHIVEGDAPPLDLDDPGTASTLFGMYGTGGPGGPLYWAEKLGREVSDDLLETGLAYGWGGAALDPAEVTLHEALTRKDSSFLDYVALRERFVGLLREVARFFKRYDLFVTLTNAQDPPFHGQWAYNGTLEQRRGFYDCIKAASPGVFQWNLMGNPAISLPLFETADRLPIGIQIVAPLSGEAQLFRIAGQLERAIPWIDRRPPVHVANRSKPDDRSDN